MAANVEADYDSDTEYVPDFDMVDLNDFTLTKGEELAGGSWEFVIEHNNDEDIVLQFALPHFPVSDELDIQEASKNGFFRVKLDPSDSKHLEFQSWIMKVETWLVGQIVNNYDNWFGHLYQEGGPMFGQSKPPASVIKDMYHPMIDEEGIFCSRVHIRKGSYEIQSMDTDQNMVELDTIKNCDVVPLVELKGVFMKPRGYNPDIVLRGLVKINPEEESDEVTANTEFALFHTADDEEQYAYYDYATEDEDTASEADDDDYDDDNDEEQAASGAVDAVTQEAQNLTVSPANYDKETIDKLMKAHEEAQASAKQAENAYQQYMTSQNASV